MKIYFDQFKLCFATRYKAHGYQHGVTLSPRFSLAALTLILLMRSSPLSASIPSGLQLSGEGEVRYMKLIKVYRAGLYVPPGVDRQRLLDAKVSRCLKLDYTVALSVDKISLAAKTVLTRQHGEQVFKQIRSDYDKLHRSYRDVSSGDTYTLCYDAASQSTSLFLNDQLQTRLLRSSRFAGLYMGMWLGRKLPISLALRDRLLAGLPASSS